WNDQSAENRRDFKKRSGIRRELRGFRRGFSGPFRNECDRRGRVDGSSPQAAKRDDQVKSINYGPAAILRREKFQEGAIHGPFLAEFLQSVLPACGLLNVIANQSDQKSRSATQGEHISPSIMAADENVGHGGEEKTNVVARVHQRRAHGAAFLGPVFGNERGPDRPFPSNSDAGHEPENRQAPYACSECRQQSEK